MPTVTQTAPSALVRSTDWVRPSEADNAARVQLAQLIGDLGACLRLNEAQALRIQTGLIRAGLEDSPLADTLKQVLALLEEARGAVKQLSVAAE